MSITLWTDPCPEQNCGLAVAAQWEIMEFYIYLDVCRTPSERFLVLVLKILVLNPMEACSWELAITFHQFNEIILEIISCFHPHPNSLLNLCGSKRKLGVRTCYRNFNCQLFLHRSNWSRSAFQGKCPIKWL